MTELELLNSWISRLNRAAERFDHATVKQVAREIEAYKLGADGVVKELAREWER